MKISELQPKTGNVELIVTVTHVDASREFEKSGVKGKVAKATIKDETGECKLSLWNEQIDEIKKGEKIKITGGWADEYKGEIQVSSGKFGKIEVLERDETIDEAITPNYTHHKKEEDKKVEPKKNLFDDEELYSAEDEVVFDADDEDII